MRTGHLGLVFCVPFTTTTLTIRWQDGDRYKKPVPLILRGSLAEQVEEDPRGTSWPKITWKNGPAHAVQWSNHLGAMCSRAWRSQWLRIDSSLSPGASAY